MTTYLHHVQVCSFNLEEKSLKIFRRRHPAVNINKYLHTICLCMSNIIYCNNALCWSVIVFRLYIFYCIFRQIIKLSAIISLKISNNKSEIIFLISLWSTEIWLVVIDSWTFATFSFFCIFFHTESKNDKLELSYSLLCAHYALFTHLIANACN